MKCVVMRGPGIQPSLAVGTQAQQMDRDDAGGAAPKLNEMQAVKAVDNIPAWYRILVGHKPSYELFAPRNMNRATYAVIV